MSNPIENNGLSNLTPNRSSRTGGQMDSSAASTSHRASVAADGRQDDAVSVSRAAEVLNREPQDRDAGGIQSPEQASQVAQTIRNFFEGNSGQALAAQAKNVSSELLLLLKAG